MFKDELNIAFENVKPSPELLDRVSAMMSEEANRRKPPLRLNVVKYAGIAAALMLAAGGTMLVLSNMNNGVKTSEAAKSIAPATVSTTTAVQEAAAGAEVKVDSIAETTAATTTTRADEAARAFAADVADVADMEEAAAAESYEETVAAQTTAAATMPASTEANNAEPAVQAEGAAATQAEFSADEDEAEAGAADDRSLDEFVTPMMIAEQVSAEENSIDSADAGSAADISGDAAPAAVDADSFGDDGMSGTKSLDTADYDYVSDDSEEAVAESDELYTGTKDIYADDPQKAFLGIEFIPDALWNSVDPDEANAWYESFPIDMASGEVPDSLESYPNVYTFINHFDISEETLKELIGYMLTDEQIYILYHGTVEEITEEFASPLSIVKGEKIYSWYWITAHTAEDYEAAGITNDDLIFHGYIVD